MLTSTVALIVGFVAFVLPLPDFVNSSADWDDFTGGCLQPAELQASGKVLVFTSVDKVLKAVERYRVDRLQDTCGPEFSDAFERLAWVLDKEHVLGDICGKEAYERVRAFHLEFIHFYVPELTRDQLKYLSAVFKGNNNNHKKGWRWMWAPKNSSASSQGDHNNNDNSASLSVNGQQQHQAHYRLKPIPAALRTFFINFVKQTNSACKHHLTLKLLSINEDSNLLDEDDLAEVAKFRHASSKANSIIEPEADEQVKEFNKLEIIDFDRQMPEFLEAEFRQAAAKGELNMAEPDETAKLMAEGFGDGSKLYLQVPFDANLHRIKTACRKRLVPIYEELFLPVIRLNNLGYIDRMNSQKEDERLEYDDDFKRWLDIIQTCEVLKDIEIVHDSSAENAIVDLLKRSSHISVMNAKRLNQQVAASEPEVKFITKKQADELREKSMKQQIRPRYDPKPNHIEHEPCKATERLWNVNESIVNKQVAEFEKDVARFVWKKTSAFEEMTRNARVSLRQVFRQAKQELDRPDESTAMGSVLAFMKRHQTLIRGFSTIFSIIMLSMALG